MLYVINEWLIMVVSTANWILASNDSVIHLGKEMWSCNFYIFCACKTVCELRVICTTKIKGSTQVSRSELVNSKIIAPVAIYSNFHALLSMRILTFFFFSVLIDSLYRGQQYQWYCTLAFLVLIIEVYRNCSNCVGTLDSWYCLVITYDRCQSP